MHSCLALHWRLREGRLSWKRAEEGPGKLRSRLDVFMTQTSLHFRTTWNLPQSEVVFCVLGICNIYLRSVTGLSWNLAKVATFMKWDLIAWSLAPWLNGETIGLELSTSVETTMRRTPDSSPKSEGCTTFTTSGATTLIKSARRRAKTLGDNPDGTIVSPTPFLWFARCIAESSFQPTSHQPNRCIYLVEIIYIFLTHHAQPMNFIFRLLLYSTIRINGIYKRKMKK